MAFGNPNQTNSQNGNNGQQQFQVSTGLLRMFDGNGNLLMFNGMENSLNITFCIPVQNGDKKSYPRDAEFRKMCLLTYDRVTALYWKILNVLLPAFKEGRSCGVGVFVNKRCSAFAEFRTEGANFYFNLFFGDQLHNRSKPKEVHTFAFQKCPVVDNYNLETGEYETSNIDAQFFAVVEMLRGYVSIGQNSVSGHSVRMANQFINNKIFAHLNALSAKLGVAAAELQTGYQKTQSQPPLSTNKPASSSKEEYAGYEDLDDPYGMIN